MVEIFLCESPANVFAESMGRFMNMIRNNLKNRMGDSLLDALMRGYRNSGHLQFWEPHLDNILFCHLDVMNCSTTNLVCKSKTGITPADVFNFDQNPPKTRNSCKSDDNFSKRQQTLRDLFNCGYDVTNLEIDQVSEPTKKSKRRLTPKNRPSPKRRLTPNKRDETRKRRKIDDEDSADTNLEDKF